MHFYQYNGKHADGFLHFLAENILDPLIYLRQTVSHVSLPYFSLNNFLLEALNPGWCIRGLQERKAKLISSCIPPQAKERVERVLLQASGGKHGPRSTVACARLGLYVLMNNVIITTLALPKEKRGALLVIVGRDVT